MPDVEYTPTKVNYGYMQVHMKVKAWCQHPHCHFIEKKKSVIKNLQMCTHAIKKVTINLITGVFFI